MSENFIRVRYSECETGWAEDLGDGTVKVANCPMTPELGLGDICSTIDNDGWRTIDKVIKQRYPHRATVWYKEKDWFLVTSGACSVKDWGMEGGCAPREDREGFFTVNYDGEESDLEALMETLGITNEMRIDRSKE